VECLLERWSGISKGISEEGKSGKVAQGGMVKVEFMRVKKEVDVTVDWGEPYPSYRVEEPLKCSEQESDLISL
jgi:hypothetical protein